MTHQKIILLIFLVVPWNTISMQQPSNTLAETELLKLIQPMILEGLRQPSPPQRAPPTKDLVKRLKQIIHDQVHSPQKARITRIIRLLSNYLTDSGQDQQLEKSSIIPQETLRDLDIFSGSHPDHRSVNLVQKIHKTRTDVGYVTLCKHCAHRATVQEISKQQEYLQKLASDQQFLASLGKLLAECRTVEGNFLSFWVSTDPGMTDLLADALHTKEFASWNPLHNQLDLSPLSCLLKEAIGFLAMSVGPIMAPVGFVAGLVTVNPVAIIGGAYFTIDQFMQLPDKYSQLKCMFTYNYLMQKKLIALSCFIKHMKELRNLLNSHLPDKLIDKLQLSQNDKKLRKLEKLLNTKTFKDEAAYFSHWGRIHTAYRLMEERRNEFLAAYATLGEIDFLASLAEMLASHLNHGYSLAHVQAGNTPSIEAAGLWNPFLSQTVVVANDVSLGTDDDNPRSLIITGPNERGKTTILRSLGLASLMAQTLGVVPAEHFTLTPLSILTSINTNDNIAIAESLFVAGVKRMAFIVNSIKQPGFYLILADEPFVGTRREIAEATAHECLTTLGLAPNTLLSATSHLNGVRQLAETHPESFANYFVAQGFHLEPGTDYTEEDYVGTAIDILRNHLGSDFAAAVQQNIPINGNHQTNSSSKATSDDDNFDSAFSDDDIAVTGVIL